MDIIEAIFLCLINVVVAKDIYFMVQEELPNGSLVGDLKLYIGSENSNLPKISTINPTVNELFILDSWLLRVRKRIDREEVCSLQLRNMDCILQLVVIYGDAAKPMFLSVSITITDLNDNSPKFKEPEIEHTVVENANPGLSDLFLYQAEDFDKLDNGTINYQLQFNKDDTQAQKFRLQITPENVPKLIQLSPLDYEIQKVYEMELFALDGGNPSKTGTLKIQVKVKDENDNAPIFQKSKYEETISEDIAVNSKVLEVLATDADADDNGRVTYRQVPTSTLQQKVSGQYFGVRNSQGKGVIYVKASIDVDVTPRISSFEFSLLACDNGRPELCTRSNIVIRVVDINDYTPTITISYLSTNGKNTEASVIPENSIDNFIAIVTVTDKDSGEGGTVECSLSNSKFGLNQGMDDRDSKSGYRVKERSTDHSTYHIRNVKEFDREETDVVRFRISCKDNPNMQKSPFVATQLSSEADVTVYIDDVNDNAPQFLRSPYEFKVLENRPSVGDKMLKLGLVEAIDKDVSSKFFYRLIQNPSQAFVLSEGGELFLKRPFDREDMVSNPQRAVVLVSDGYFNTTTNVNIVILDDNDLAPVFKTDTYRLSCVENEFSSFLGIVQATDGDSDEFGPIEYRIFPPSPMFSINSRSGMIRVTTRLNREETSSYSFTVIAIDNTRERSHRNTGTATVSITVQDLNDNYPTIIYPPPQKVIVIDPSWAAGHKVFTINAADPDLLENGTLTYKIIKDGLRIFNIDAKSGDVFLSRKLSVSESQGMSSHLILMASDNGLPPPKTTKVTVIVKIATDNSQETPDFGTDFYQGSPPQVDRSSRKTLIIIIIVALVLIVTVIMTILIVIYQSRMPTQNQLTRNNKRKEAEFHEINRNQFHPSVDVTQHFMRSDENFVVPVTNRYFQNSLSLMRHEDRKDIVVDKSSDSSHIDEYQQLMTTPTLMRIWHNNLSPYSDTVPTDKDSHGQLPSITTTSGLVSNESINEINKSNFKEQCSTNNYLQSSFV